MQELFVQKLNAYVKSIGTSPSSIAYFTADNFNDRLQIDSNLWGQYCVTPTSFAGESWAVAETSKQTRETDTMERRLALCVWARNDVTCAKL